MLDRNRLCGDSVLMSANGYDSEKYRRCLEDIGKLLYRTSAVFQTIEKDFVRAQNISTSQANMLIMIAERQGFDTNMSEMVDAMNLEKSTVTRLVDSLADKGLVIKKRSGGDRREVFLLLSDKGKRSARDLKRSRMDYYRAVLERLPKGRVREVMNSFELLLDAFDAERR